MHIYEDSDEVSIITCVYLAHGATYTCEHALKLFTCSTWLLKLPRRSNLQNFLKLLPEVVKGSDNCSQLSWGTGLGAALLVVIIAAIVVVVVVVVIVDVVDAVDDVVVDATIVVVAVVVTVVIVAVI